MTIVPSIAWWILLCQCLPYVLGLWLMAFSLVRVSTEGSFVRLWYHWSFFFFCISSKAILLWRVALLWRSECSIRHWRKQIHFFKWQVLFTHYALRYEASACWARRVSRPLTYSLHQTFRSSVSGSLRAVLTPSSCARWKEQNLSIIKISA